MGDTVWVLLLTGAGVLWAALVYLVSAGLGERAEERGALRPVWLVLLSARESREARVGSPNEELSTPLVSRRRPAA